MRPRKIVLCVAGSESRLAERAFLLTTRGYAVLRADSIAAAQEYLSGDEAIAVMLVDLPLLEWADGAIVTANRKRRQGLRTLVLSNSAGYQDTVADAYLPTGSDSASEILERLKLLTRVKRGPKKQVPSVGFGASVAEFAARPPRESAQRFGIVRYNSSNTEGKRHHETSRIHH